METSPVKRQFDGNSPVLKKLLFCIMLPCVINALVFSGLKVSIDLYFSNKKEACRQTYQKN